MHYRFLLLIAFLTCVSCHAQIPGLAESHIAANVPSTNDFRPFLIRDLKAYLKPTPGDKLTVDYELLREARRKAALPTRSFTFG